MKLKEVLEWEWSSSLVELFYPPSLQPDTVNELQNDSCHYGWRKSWKWNHWGPSEEHPPPPRGLKFRKAKPSWIVSRISWILFTRACFISSIWMIKSLSRCSALHSSPLIHYLYVAPRQLLHVLPYEMFGAAGNGWRSRDFMTIRAFNYTWLLNTWL